MKKTIKDIANEVDSLSNGNLEDYEHNEIILLMIVKELRQIKRIMAIECMGDIDGKVSSDES